MTPDDLEPLIADRLRRLPAPLAPPTLHRRVMTAVSATRPVVRPWSIWPRVWQAIVALGFATIATACAAVWLTAAANARGDAGWQIAVQAIVSATDTPSALRDALLSSFTWFTALLSAPAAVAIFALVAAAALAFIALGVWLSRLALPPLVWSKGVSR
jgi:hypothetical protein